MKDALKKAKKDLVNKDTIIISKEKEIDVISGKLNANELKIDELGKDLGDKEKELNQQIKKNTVIQNLLNKKNEDVAEMENLNISKENNGQIQANFACNVCDFSGKSKSGFKKHLKNKHGKANVQDEIPRKSESGQFKESSEVDEFANKINSFWI